MMPVMSLYIAKVGVVHVAFYSGQEQPVVAGSAGIGGAVGLGPVEVREEARRVG